MKTIFLCGFMGCGKTTVGKKLARELNMNFIDLDEYIVRKEGRSIPEIFSTEGEAYFRKAEADAIREISGKGGIIATGGGAILNPATAELARSRGTVCFIDVPFEVCYKRIQGDTNRPLVMNNTKESLSELYEKRKPVYGANSDRTIPGDAPIKAILEKIISVSE